MISIKSAIDELNRSEIIRDDGEPAMCTPGELIILLERLKALDSLTKRVPISMTLKQWAPGRKPGTTVRVVTNINMDIITPIDTDERTVNTVLQTLESVMEGPPSSLSLISALEKVCSFHGWRRSPPGPPKEDIDLVFDYTNDPERKD